MSAREFLGGPGGSAGLGGPGFGPVLTVLASTAVSMVPTWVVTPTVGK